MHEKLIIQKQQKKKQQGKKTAAKKIVRTRKKQSAQCILYRYMNAKKKTIITIIKGKERLKEIPMKRHFRTTFTLGVCVCMWYKFCCFRFCTCFTMRKKYFLLKLCAFASVLFLHLYFFLNGITFKTIFSLLSGLVCESSALTLFHHFVTLWFIFPFFMITFFCFLLWSPPRAPPLSSVFDLFRYLFSVRLATANANFFIRCTLLCLFESEWIKT